MPTIIALDVSLSMLRSIPGRSEDNALTYQQLAAKGVSQFLEHLANTSKLEYVALVTYSYTCEVIVDFTRDYDQVRQAVKKVEMGNIACMVHMLKTVAGILSTNWGTTSLCQVVAFTDGSLGIGSTGLKQFLHGYEKNKQDAEYAWLTLLKKVKLNFVCMGVQSDLIYTKAMLLYQKFMELTGLKNQIFLPKPLKDALESDETSSVPATASHKSELGRTAMLEIIERLCEANYKMYEATLKCGGYFRLECPILIWPPPQPYRECDDSIPRIIKDKIEVCGYLALSEIGSPASLSRHLIIPKVEREKPTRHKDKAGSSKSHAAVHKPPLNIHNPHYEYEKLEQDIREFYTKDSKDTDESGDDVEMSANKSSTSSNAIPEIQKESVCVLLHGALKVENLAALVLLNENWYGFLYSFADSKKKSNLMLNILPPGNNVIPWLGDLQLLGFAEDVVAGEVNAFPVKAEKRSYSQSCVVWIKHVSLQSDIQKVLRHAKKIPEKTQHFYKELNRIRRAAISIGFVELLEALATLLEKESAHLSVSANPECSLQLKHAAIELRKPSNRDLKILIGPLQKFPAAGFQEASNAPTPAYIY